MAWAAFFLLLVITGLLHWWRRRSFNAVLTAMTRNERIDLPALAHPEGIALAQAHRRLRSRATREVDGINSQRNELRALLKGMTDAVVAVDRAERILTINEACLDLFDCKHDEAIGRGFLEVCRNPLLHKILRETLTSEMPIVREAEFGSAQRHLQISGTPYLSPAHRNGAVLVIRDTTNVRRLQEHRREFVANVSHELKTPITSVKGYAETLLDGALEEPENARRFIKVILTQSNHLAALVEDLLQLSRIEQSEGGEVELEIQKLQPLLSEAILMVQPLADSRRTRIEINCAPDFLVNCNAGMIELAVRNLVENAVKYSQEGSKVTVNAHVAEGNVHIEVADTGGGIAAEHHERLFERFYRVDKSRSKALGGTGLGLAIVKHIAQAHLGTVRVESATGVGTTFTIVWPA